MSQGSAPLSMRRHRHTPRPSQASRGLRVRPTLMMSHSLRNVRLFCSCVCVSRASIAGRTAAWQCMVRLLPYVPFVHPSIFAMHDAVILGVFLTMLTGGIPGMARQAGFSCPGNGGTSERHSLHCL